MTCAARAFCALYDRLPSMMSVDVTQKGHARDSRQRGLAGGLFVALGLLWLLLTIAWRTCPGCGATPATVTALTPGTVAAADSPLFAYSPGWQVSEAGADPAEPDDSLREPAGVITFTYTGDALWLLLAPGDFWAYLYASVDGAPANRLAAIADNLDSQGAAAGYTTLLAPELAGTAAETRAPALGRGASCHLPGSRPRKVSTPSAWNSGAAGGRRRCVRSPSIRHRLRCIRQTGGARCRCAGCGRACCCCWPGWCWLYDGRWSLQPAVCKVCVRCAGIRSAAFLSPPRRNLRASSAWIMLALGAALVIVMGRWGGRSLAAGTGWRGAAGAGRVAASRTVAGGAALCAALRLRRESAAAAGASAWHHRCRPAGRGSGLVARLALLWLAGVEPFTAQKA